MRHPDLVYRDIYFSSRKHGYDMHYRLMHPHFDALFLRKVESRNPVTEETDIIYRVSHRDTFYFEFAVDPDYLDTAFGDYFPDGCSDDTVWQRDYHLLNAIFHMSNEEYCIRDTEKYFYHSDPEKHTVSISHAWRSPEVSVRLCIGSPDHSYDMDDLNRMIRSFQCIKGNRYCQQSDHSIQVRKQCQLLNEGDPVYYPEPIIPILSAPKRFAPDMPSSLQKKPPQTDRRVQRLF